jgi:hypothetical protein
MAFSKEIEAFIKDFVKDLSENNAAIFASVSGILCKAAIASRIVESLQRPNSCRLRLPTRPTALQLK